jgi:hypothetical protein
MTASAQFGASATLGCVVGFSVQYGGFQRDAFCRISTAKSATRRKSGTPGQISGLPTYPANPDARADLTGAE